MPDVFAAVDLEWTDEVDERVRTWREENPKGKRGTHEYRLDDYGLDRDRRRGVRRLHRALRHPERVGRRLTSTGFAEQRYVIDVAEVEEA